MSECRNPLCDRPIRDAVFCCEPCSTTYHRGHPTGHSERCDEKAVTR